MSARHPSLAVSLKPKAGCLICSFDIQNPGTRSIVEVALDAGTGKVLALKRGSCKAQVAEKAADAAAAKTKESISD
jgi:hypothetical protein